MKLISIPVGQSIDSHLKRNREPGTVFLLGHGTYYTNGAFAFEDFDCCMLAPGCMLKGEGPFKTRIELLGPVLTHKGKPTGYLECLTGGARTAGSSEFIGMEGFRLCLSETSVPTIGVHIWSSGAHVVDVQVEDVIGHRQWSSRPNEGFGILINTAHEAGAPFEGASKVSRCRVLMRETPEENYSTGIYIGNVRGYVPLLRSVISDSEVVSTDGHCGLAFNDHVDVLRCSVYGTRRAIFADTGPIRNSRVSELDAHGVGWGVELRTSGGQAVRSNIKIERSSFAFRPVDGVCQGILLCDDSPDKSGVIEGVIVKDCTWIRPEGAEASKGRSNGKRVSGVCARDNYWVGKWSEPVIQAEAGPWL